MSADTTAFQLVLQQWDVLSKWIVPIATFLLGFLVSRFTMTKKERKDHSAALQEKSNALSAAWQEAFDKYTTVLAEYAGHPGNPTFSDFTNIATAGEGYFTAVRIISDSILSDNLDKTSVKNTHLPMIKDVVDRTLPNHYKTLQDIAKKNGFPYQGKLDVKNYESIYEVYSKRKLGNL